MTFFLLYRTGSQSESTPVVTVNLSDSTHTCFVFSNNVFIKD